MRSGVPRPKQAKNALASLQAKRSDLQRFVFDILVQKVIWQEDENLDLTRANYPMPFTDSALRAAKRIDHETV